MVSLTGDQHRVQYMCNNLEKQGGGEMNVTIHVGASLLVQHGKSRTGTAGQVDVWSEMMCDKR
jgi:hypothetical protein